MTDNLPVRKIDRDALERIIRRAAELQAGEMDTGEALTEAELLKLGADVGIDGRFLRQALYEQSAGAGESEKGLVARWFGPGRVSAGRVLPGDKETIEQALAHWMAEGEALTVKRRMSDRTVWERQKGFFAEMKRGFGVGGKNYHLARAHDVTVVVTALEQGFCHVELTADVSKLRGGAVGGSVAASGSLALVGGLLLAIAATPTVLLYAVVMVPIAAAAASPVLAGRMQRTRNEHMQLALEQVLDRLEHGEIRPQHRGAEASPLLKVAVEIRRAITESVEQSRRGQRQLPKVDLNRKSDPKP